MKCKFCGAQMEQDQLICPACGEKNRPEKKENEFVSPWKIVAATVAAMLLLGVLLVVVINSITERNWPFDLFTKETTSATDGGSATTGKDLIGPEELGMDIEGLTDIALFTGDDEAAIAAADAVVAQIGEYKLTNKLLQVFYFMEFSNFVQEAQQNGYDVKASYNLDITKPMGDQLVVGSTVTWEQFFLHTALETWWRYVSVNTLADKAGFEISAEDRAELDGIPAQLEADAVKEGFENAQALIKDRLGASCDLDTYIAYMELTARGDLYYGAYQKTYTPTKEEVEAFFELNTDYYTYYGISKELGKLAAVRHVLLVPEGATTDKSTGHVTATDEQWAAGQTQAQKLLDDWVAAGATQDGFAAMAKEHSTDGGSKENGGLYEGVYAGQMVKNFDAWVFDETRKPGDYGIVRTEFGYHLMYFVSLSENDAWYEYAYQDAISYGYGFNQLLSKEMEANKLVPSLNEIVLADVAQEVPAKEDTTDPTKAAE